MVVQLAWLSSAGKGRVVSGRERVGVALDKTVVENVYAELGQEKVGA